jgi:hypothetical protein
MSNIITLAGTFQVQLAVTGPTQDDQVALLQIAQKQISAGAGNLSLTGATFSITCLDGSTAQVTQQMFNTYLAAIAPPNP